MGKIVSSLEYLGNQIHSYRNDVKVREDHLLRTRAEDKEDHLRTLNNLSEKMALTIENTFSKLEAHTNKVNALTRADIVELRGVVDKVSESHEFAKEDLKTLKAKVSKLNYAYLTAFIGGSVLLTALSSEKFVKIIDLLK